MRARKSQSTPAPPAPRDLQLTRALTDWFARSARDLPWRQTGDPYAIWVSEIMLQQTQVATVIPYWIRWMQALPHVQALAEAPLETVLKLWEGLGYYRRARHLHAAARLLVKQYPGTWPATREAWLELPGIGPYTAGAIASIAFDQPAPIVDGNIVRVISRLDAMRAAVREKQTRNQIWQRATSLVQAANQTESTLPRRRFPPCSALNQSLMELGATLCTPKNPACHACPVRALCGAHQNGLVGEIPQLAERPRPINIKRRVLVWRRGRQVLLRQNPAEAHNAGLWEFPSRLVEGPSFPGEDPPPGPSTLEENLPVVATLRHTITKHRITLEIVVGQGPRPPAHLPGRWINLTDLAALPVPAAHRRIIREILPRYFDSPVKPRTACGRSRPTATTKRCKAEPSPPTSTCCSPP